MDIVVMGWVHTSLCLEIVGAINYTEEFEFKTKGEEDGVLTWRRDDLGNDPFSGDCKTSVPTSGELVVSSGVKEVGAMRSS